MGTEGGGPAARTRRRGGGRRGGSRIMDYEQGWAAAGAGAGAAAWRRPAGYPPRFSERSCNDRVARCGFSPGYTLLLRVSCRGDLLQGRNCYTLRKCSAGVLRVSYPKPFWATRCRGLRRKEGLPIAASTRPRSGRGGRRQKSPPTTTSGLTGGMQRSQTAARVSVGVSSYKHAPG